MARMPVVPTTARLKQEDRWAQEPEARLGNTVRPRLKEYYSRGCCGGFGCVKAPTVGQPKGKVTLNDVGGSRPVR